MNKQVDDSYWKELQSRMDQLSVASRYYALSNLFHDVMDIAENLDDHTKWVIFNLANIRLKAFEMFPSNEFYKSLNKEIRLEREMPRTTKGNEE